MIPCHASGSSSDASSVEPLTSANRMVTCLRSPSRAERDLRSFSARCFGVYERGSGCFDSFEAAASGFPHSPQNFIDGGFSKPQLAHLTFSDEPHAPQNFMPLAFSKPQAGQRMDGYSEPL